MLARMSQGRKIAIAGAAVSAVVIGVMIAMYVINPFNTASDDPRARILGYTIYRMPSLSMEPTIREGEYFLISAFALRNRDPRIGEIVAFRYPPNPEIHYLKRVVATGGTTIEMRKGELYIDGQRIAEPWLPEEPIRSIDIPDRTITLREEDIFSDLAPLNVPAGQFFVLGDNRGNSEDSRTWGFVPRESMIGIVVD